MSLTTKGDRNSSWHISSSSGLSSLWGELKSSLLWPWGLLWQHWQSSTVLGLPFAQLEIRRWRKEMPRGEILLNFVTKWANRWIGFNLWRKHLNIGGVARLDSSDAVLNAAHSLARLWEPPVRHSLAFHVRRENNSPKIKGSLSGGKCPLGDLIERQVAAASLWNRSLLKTGLSVL